MHLNRKHTGWAYRRQLPLPYASFLTPSALMPIVTSFSRTLRQSVGCLRSSVLTLLSILGLAGLQATAAGTATTSTLAVTSGGGVVTTVASRTVVTLTATVTAGSAAVTVGQVKFCDAGVAYCTDIHLLGTAQLTNAGTAAIKLRPGVGSHSFKAVFSGTTGIAGSSSSTAALAVTGGSTTSTLFASDGSTATVYGWGKSAPSGRVSFVDTTNNDAVLGTASLQSGTQAFGFINSGTGGAAQSDAGSVAIGDFNGDGFADIAVAESFENAIGILLGNGEGTFQSTSLALATGQIAVSVVVGDFNEDGILDIAAGTFTASDSVQVWLGNGDGTFSAAPAIPQTGTLGSVLAVGDFNRDGHADLIVGNNDGNTITVLLGKGDGTFTAVAESPVTSSLSLTVGDFNGDGILDLAAVDTAGTTLTVLLGNGDGTFNASSSAIQAGTGPDYIAAGDFNGDGIPDLALASSGGGGLLGGNGTLTLLVGKGDGTFTATTTSPLTGPTTSAIAVGDFNGDGLLDVAVAFGLGRDSYPATVLLGDGHGNFTSASSGIETYETLSIAAADFNGDGVSDLAIPDYSSPTGAVSVYLAENQTATATAPELTLPPATGTHQVAANYEGDSNYRASTSNPIAFTAAKGPSTLGLAISPSPASYGAPVTLTASVSGSGLTATGTVTFSAATGQLGTATLNSTGVASFVESSFTIGSYSIIATYGGDSNYTASSSAAISLTVNKALSTVTVTPAASSIGENQSLAVTITVAGSAGLPTPTGAVTLVSGQYSAQNPISSGSASFTIPAGTLSSGDNTLTATYAGDATYGGSSGTASVAASPVAIAISSPSAVSPGASTTATATFSATSTYSGTINLTCTLSGSPTGAQSLPTCSLNPASVTFTSGGTVNSAVTVKTTAATSGALARPFLWRLGSGAALASLLMLCIPARSRNWLSMLELVSIVVFGGLTGCGGGGSSTTGPSTLGTTAGIYTFSVTGKDTSNANITIATSFTVTVQ